MSAPVRSGTGVGTVHAQSDAARAYVDHLVGLLELPGSLTGMDLALDCANGATSVVAPEVFDRLGARVVVRAAAPDGCNINEHCGATHPGCRWPTPSRPAGSSSGLAFDGDGDRLIAVDHTGAIVDGDHIIAICALDLHRRGLLRHGTVVVTVMTNLGFRLAMEQAGINVVETAVGDRYVLEALEAGGYSLGGEQSGHVVFTDLATTGDGILTGLVLADIVQRSRPHAGRAGRRGDDPPAPGARERPGGGESAVAADGVRGGRGREGRGRARGHRAGAGAPEWHRADRAGHGRGGHATTMAERRRHADLAAALA